MNDSGQDFPRVSRSGLRRRFRRVSHLVLLVLLVGLAWRVGRYSVRFPVWGDEAFVGVNFVERDYSGLTRPPLEYGQIAPLGFMWAELAISRLLGVSDWSLRLLPWLSGMGAFLLFWRFAANVLDRRAALLATAILAASYYVVRHGAEIKPYAGDLVISLILTCLAWSVSRHPRSVGRWTALTTAASLSVWMSFPAAFVVCGLGMFLTWDTIRRRSGWGLVSLAVYAVAGAGSFAAMYFLYAKSMASHSSWYWTIPTWREAFPPLSRPWLLPWWFIKVHTGNMMAYPAGGRNFGSAGTFVLVVWGCVSLWRGKRRDLLVLLLCPALASLVAAAAGEYPYGTSARVSLHLAPAICLLAGVGLRAALCALVPRRLVPEGVRMASIVLAGIALTGLILDVAKPYKRWDHEVTRRAVPQLTSRISASDQVLLGVSKRKDEFLPWIEGTASATFRFYLCCLSQAPIQWAVPPEKIKPIPGRTWLVYYAVPRLPQEEDRAAAFHAYLEKVKLRLGEPRYHEYELFEPHKGHKNMKIQVYEFGSGGTCTVPGTDMKGTSPESHRQDDLRSPMKVQIDRQIALLSPDREEQAVPEPVGWHVMK